MFAYPQRYEHIRADPTGAVVRFTSLGIHEGFTSKLQVDRDGLVLVYPQLANRVGSQTSLPVALPMFRGFVDQPVPGG